MPNIQSAEKRVRTSEKARRRNRAIKAEISTIRRRVFESVSAKDKDKVRQAFRDYCSALDKAAQKGVIKKNTAMRRKRRAALNLAMVEKAG